MRLPNKTSDLPDARWDISNNYKTSLISQVPEDNFYQECRLLGSKTVYSLKVNRCFGRKRILDLQCRRICQSLIVNCLKLVPYSVYSPNLTYSTETSFLSKYYKTLCSQEIEFSLNSTTITSKAIIVVKFGHDFGVSFWSLHAERCERPTSCFNRRYDCFVMAEFMTIFYNDWRETEGEREIGEIVTEATFERKNLV